MRRLRPPFYKQEKDNSCLPACLRMVLAAGDVFLSEQQARELCGWMTLRSKTRCGNSSKWIADGDGLSLLSASLA